MTIEIAAWVLTGCLLVCVGFMIWQERRHRRKVINQEIQIQTLRDRVTSLTSLTNDIQASLRRRGDPRAGTSPPPDGDEQTDEASRRMRQYVATREFVIGNSGPIIPRGERIEFDGRGCTFGGQRIEAPQLRGAIQGGWLVPLEPESRGWGRALESLTEQLQGPAAQQQVGVQRMEQLRQQLAAFATQAPELPEDWQERLASPEAIEGLEPRGYEVGDEAVIANGSTFEPGALIPVEVVAHLPPEHVRKFLDAKLITPSQRDPRPTRYDRLTEDDDD